MCREARRGTCVEHAEEVRPERAGAGEAQDPSTGCQADSSGGAGTCEQCEAPIGGTAYCSKCNEPDTYAPVDGVCEDIETQTDKKALCTVHTDGACTECGSTSFLYKGGCYQPGDGKPGQSLCVLAAGGVCTEAATGYFIPTGAASTEQSVVACNDEAGVAVGGTTYKGIANCQECAAPDVAPGARADTVATCTRCADPNYLKTVSGVTTCETECGEGYFKNDNGGSDSQTKVCVSCGDTNAGVPNCAKCTAPTTTGQKPACSECNSGFALSEDKTTCIQSPGAQCKAPGCKTCDNPAEDNEVCTVCNNGRYLAPTSQCVDDCGKLGSYYGAAGNKCKECTVANCAECSTNGSCQTCNTGFYLDNSECKACDSSCKSCSGATNADCIECSAGKVLKYGSDGTKGMCGDGCTTGTGSGACKTCGLTVEGTAYCSECSKSDEYPQNGVCAGAAGGRAITCTTPGTGVCTTCANGLLKMNGGCYETSRYPGKSVCMAVASNGNTCDSPAPGYKVDSSGNFVTCPEGCKACSDASTCTACADGYVLVGNACTTCHTSCLTCETDASTCTACASGYYKTTSGSGACTSCEADNGSVKGVKGCANCAAPTGSTGPVLCYLVGMVLLGPSPHVPVGMSALLFVSRISSPSCWVRHMVAERPSRQ